MKTELKPCPFCGGEVELVREKGDQFEFVLVSCKNCNATIGIGGSDNKRKVTKAWNTRSNPWHTDTPKEEGEYLCWVVFPEQICVDTEGSWKCKWEAGKWYENQYEGKLRMIEDLGAKIIAWQRIEPYKETRE